MASGNHEDVCGRGWQAATLLLVDYCNFSLNETLVRYVGLDVRLVYLLCARVNLAVPVSQGTSTKTFGSPFISIFT